MNSKINHFTALLIIATAILLLSFPCRADVGNIPTTGNYPYQSSPVVIQPPVYNPDIYILAAVTVPFQEQFSFSIGPDGTTNRTWYIDNYYIYLQNTNRDDDVGGPFAGVLFKASRNGLPETIISASVRLVLARPVSPNTTPDLKFYRVKPEYQWSAKSFSSHNCLDAIGNCYDSPKDVIDITNPLIVTGEIRYEGELNDRPVLYADISKGFSEHGFSASDGIFMELSNDIGGDGVLGVATFFGKDAPSPALEASLVYRYDSHIQTAIGVNTCGDGICDPFENNCAVDCEGSNDIEPPGLSFTVSPDGYQMDTGTHISATAQRTGGDEDNSSQNSSSLPSWNIPVFDTPFLDDLPNIHDLLGPALNMHLFDPAEPIAPLSIWVAGFSAAPWNIFLCTTDDNICNYEGSPAPGLYKLCARARDDAGNLSETLCKDFRIGSATPPEISVRLYPPDVRLGETLNLQVSASDYNEGLTSITVDLLDDHQTFLINGSKTWMHDFDIPLCDWDWSSEYPPGKLNPINIYVSAKDGEQMRSSYWDIITPKFPVQARYGLGVENFGSNLSWNQYAHTFGNEVYGSVSICIYPPWIFPGICRNNRWCNCYSGTPDSTISDIVNDLGGWLMEAIVDAIGINDNLENYFGVTDLSRLGVPDLFALLFFPIYRIAGKEGLCTGFTTASAMLTNQAATPDEICPGCGSEVSSWSENDISFYVGHRQGSVVSSEFIHLLLNNYADSADTVIRKLHHSLTQGLHPGISIIGYPEDTDSCKQTGHSMLVDRVRNRGDGIYRVYVYDSNRPDTSGDAEKTGQNFTAYCNQEHSPYIDVDTVNDNFSFWSSSGGPEWTRGNGRCNLHVDLGALGDVDINPDTPDAALLHLPFSLLSRDTFTMPLSIEGMITMFVGNATVTVEDNAGNVMGTDGAQHNGIPGAYLFPLPAAENGGEEITLFLMPEDTPFTVQAAGKPDTGHFINVISPTGTSTFLFAKRGARENFSIVPQADGLKVSISAEQFNGALHLLAEREVPLTAIAENVDDSLRDETVPYTQVYSFTGSFGQHPASFMIEKEGTLTTIANQAQPVKLFALSNENAVGDDKQHPLSTIFKTSSRQINIPAGVNHINFDLPNRNTTRPFLISPVSKLNAAPVAMAAYTLNNPAVAPAANLQLMGSKKTNVAIVPELHIPAELQGKRGNFYALLYWIEDNTWFQFTPAGIELLSAGLKPFRTATSAQTAEFDMLKNGVDLSDFRGSFYVFTGFATEDDLSDLVYNYYQLSFQ